MILLTEHTYRPNKQVYHLTDVSVISNFGLFFERVIRFKSCSNFYPDNLQYFFYHQNMGNVQLFSAEYSIIKKTKKAG